MVGRALRFGVILGEAWEIRYGWARRLRAMFLRLWAFLGEVRDIIWGAALSSWAFLGASWGGFGRWLRAEREAWRLYFRDIVRGCQTRFGRPKKDHVEFTWRTYYVAVTRSLRLARIAKSLRANGVISAWTCCELFDRYERLRARAFRKGYVKLAEEDIHDKYIVVRDWWRY